MRIESDGTIIGEITSNVIITATYQGITSQFISFDIVDEASISILNINASNNNLAVGSKSTVKATAYLDNKFSQDITQQVKWVSENNNILDIDANGVITAKAVGSTTVYATFNNVRSNAINIYVNSSSLVSISISAVDNLIPEGSSSQMVATGYYSDGSRLDLTNQVTWSSSAPSIISVSTQGKATANKEGSAIVSAVFDNVTSNQLSFNVNKAKLINIVVYSTNNNVSVGSEIQATAKGYYSDGSTMDLTSDVVWKSSDSSIANIDASGKITANRAGITSISAYFSGIDSNTLAFSVSEVTLSSIAIHLTDNNITKGSTTKAVATGYYSNGTQRDISSEVFWSSSNLNVANIDFNGNIIGNNVGSTSISASFGDIQSNNLGLTIRDATLKQIVINVDDNNIPMGTKIKATAKGYYSDGTTEDITSQVSWLSSNQTVVSVDSNGNISGNIKGQSTVVASLNGVDSNSLSVIVSEAVLKELVINLDSAVISKGSFTNARATGYYSDGTRQDLTSEVAWSSSDSSTANITQNGQIQSLKIGNTSISAKFGNLDSNILVLSVTDAVLKSISISISDNSIASGLTSYATAVGYFSDGTQQNVTNQVNWSSSDSNIANINKNGEISGIKQGLVYIEASSGNIVSNKVSFNVDTAKLKSIDVTLSANNIPDGTEIQATAIGNYTNGDRTDITKQVSWSSTDPNIANISSNGIIVANKSGSVNIKATFGDVSSSIHTLNIVTAVLQQIDISVDKTNIPSGMNAQLTAIGHYSNSKTEDITNLVEWSSNNNKVLNIAKNGQVTGSDVGSASIVAKYNGVNSNSIPFVVTAATLKNIVINVKDNTIPAGLGSQLTATGIYSDNSQKDLTTQVSWSSSSTSIANINSNGLITGHLVGAVNVKATYGEITSNAVDINITQAKLTSIVISFDQSTVPAGVSAQATAKGYYSDGSNQNITSQVTWKSGSETVANIDSNGKITSSSVGVSLISASYGSVDSSSTPFTVTSAKLKSITVNVVDSSIPVGVSTNASAKGYYTDGSTKDITNQVIWASSSPSTVNVGNSSSSTISLTALKVGTSSISASLDGVTSNSIQMNVTVAKLASINVTVPDSRPYAGVVNQAKATGWYTDGSSKDLTDQVIWKADNNWFTGGINITADGKYIVGKNTTAGANGVIYAELEGLKSNEVVLDTWNNAMKGLSISIDDNSIAAGTSTNLHAVLTMTDGSQLNLSNSDVDWQSSSPSTINISSDGVVTAYKAGTVTISASYDSILKFGDRVYASPITITVSGRALEKITINMSTGSMASGTSTNAVATGWYYDNTSQDLTNQVSWVSSDTTVANISANGTITGNKAGSTKISAKFNNINSNTLDLNVTPATLKSMELSLVTYNIAAGTNTQATVIGSYSDGSTQNITNQVAFVSSDTAIASVDSNGELQSHKAGNIMLQAKYGTNILSNQVSVNVTSALLKSIEVTPSNIKLAKGTNQSLIAKGIYTDRTEQDLTSQVIWTSADDATASINNGGTLVANKVGNTTIQAKYGSINSASIPVQITAATISSIKVNVANNSLSAGKTTNATAIGVYTDGSEQDLTNQVSWTSSDNSIANIDASGKIFGEKDGNATITAEYGQLKSSTNIKVNGNYLKSLKLEVGQTDLTVNVKTSYKVIGTYSDGTQKDITTDVSLSSNNYSSLNVYRDNKSIYAYNAGSYNLYVQDGSVKSNIVSLNVVNAVLVSVETIDVPTNISVGEYGFGTITVKGKFSDGLVKDANSSLTWAVSDSNIADTTYSGSFIKGYKVGTVTVTAKYGSWSKSFIVNVGEALPYQLRMDFKSSYPYTSYNSSSMTYTVKPNIYNWFRLYLEYTDGNQIELNPNGNTLDNDSFVLNYSLELTRNDIFSSTCDGDMRCYIYSTVNYATTGIYTVRN